MEKNDVLAEASLNEMCQSDLKSFLHNRNIQRLQSVEACKEEQMYETIDLFMWRLRNLDDKIATTKKVPQMWNVSVMFTAMLIL